MKTRNLTINITLYCPTLDPLNHLICHLHLESFLGISDGYSSMSIPSLLFAMALNKWAIF